MNKKTNYRPLKDRAQNLFILFIALGTFLSSNKKLIGDGFGFSLPAFLLQPSHTAGRSMVGTFQVDV